MKQYR